MLGFVFPGETAAIFGGVLASKGGVSLGRDPRRGDRCAPSSATRWGTPSAIAGGTSSCGSAPCASARRGSRRRSTSCAGAAPWPCSSAASRPSCAPSSPACRACPRCTTASSCRPTRSAASAGAPSTCSWATSSAQRVEKASGIASDVLLGVIAVVIVVLVVRHWRTEKRDIEGTVESAGPAVGPERRAGRRRRPGRRRPLGPERPAGAPARQRRRPTRANSPAASSPWASVSIQRGAGGIAAVHAEEAEARLVGAPLVVVDQRPVQVGPHGHARRPRRRRPPRGARARSAGGPGRPAAARAGRRAPGSPCRSRPPTAGGPGAGPTRWRTRHPARPGRPRRPTAPARRTSRAPRRGGGVPGHAWRGWPPGRTSRSRPRRGHGVGAARAPRRRTRRGARRRVRDAQARPGRAPPRLAHGAVRRHGGEEPAQRRLAGVARREGGVVHRPALVDVAVDVARDRRRPRGAAAGRAASGRARRPTTSSC